MFLTFVALAAFLIFLTGTAAVKYPDQTPALGKYQDLTMAFPLNEPWYQVYRNYEEDPVLGSSKCLRFTPAGPEKGEDVIRVEYGDYTQSIDAPATLEAGEGYTVANKLNFVPEGQNQPLSLYVSFLDPGKCSVSRNVYVNDDACAVVVLESQLGTDITSCDFIYDLLCGTTKYNIYDETCKKQD